MAESMESPVMMNPVVPYLSLNEPSEMAIAVPCMMLCLRLSQLFVGSSKSCLTQSLPWGSVLNWSYIDV